MKIPDTPAEESLFNADEVEQQLGRIFHGPHFTESPILKKFLAFIVQETLSGRSNCLKEYTIALNVLDKPHNFNPQESGIVRIHAGRLRRALGQYYDGIGRNDEVVITIPKGKYVPVFKNRHLMNASWLDDEPADYGYKSEDDGRIILAVLPFLYTTKHAPTKSFAEGLCLQMNSMLTRVKHISVIAYQALKNLDSLHPDYRAMGNSLGFNHVITGGVQSLGYKVRVSIQLIDCITYRLQWSETFERQLTRSNFFELEDEICLRVVGQLDEYASRDFSARSALPVAL
jgi:TolB-like protein